MGRSKVMGTAVIEENTLFQTPNTKVDENLTTFLELTIDFGVVAYVTSRWSQIATKG